MTRSNAARRMLPQRDHRNLVELRGYGVRGNSEIIDLRVFDLSYDGCGIESPARLVPGEEMKISVLGRGATNATVKWTDGRRAGLTFEAEPRKQSPRKAERIQLAGEAFLRRTGKIGFRVRVFDLSQFGCKCEFVDRPVIEERVWLKFDGLEALESDVCWLEGSTLGVEFSRPLHSAVLNMLVDRQAVA
jgi:hypothetical protein